MARSEGGGHGRPPDVLLIGLLAKCSPTEAVPETVSEAEPEAVTSPEKSTASVAEPPRSVTRQPRPSRSTSERAPPKKSKRARRRHGQGVEAALGTIVPEPGTLRRGDIVSEILTHTDIANAPPGPRAEGDTPCRPRQHNPNEYLIPTQAKRSLSSLSGIGGVLSAT